MNLRWSASPSDGVDGLVPPLGAVVDGEMVTYRVWAPAATTIDVMTEHTVTPMAGCSAGMFVATVAGGHGDRYRFRLDGATILPDPMSRDQPDGVDGPSAVVDPATFVWTDDAWPGLVLEELVIYELHVGAFTPAGTFDSVVPRLAELRELGVTAIELMPVATFPGRRGWGYDGLYTSAPHAAYGGPAGLARLVDAAHRQHLGVILDVVYNHFGPGSEALTAFGPYTDPRHETFWGASVAYAHAPVREWAVQNAERWVRDFHVDGLRLDAVHAIHDDRSPHIVEELTDRVHRCRERALVISEIDTGDVRPLRSWHNDAQWGDELHHAVHVLLTHERDGYYAEYGRVADVALQYERADAARLVVCAQNHDQVGNRAFGDRLRGRKLRLAAFCAILAPGIPLLFMGEEYDESHPFLFFADHVDPEIARATRQGRRREFARFAAFAHEAVPDPGDVVTFVRSQLDPAAGDPEHLAYYRWLLAVRATLPCGPVDTVVDEDARMLRVRRGSVELVMNFSEVDRDGVPAWSGAVR